MPSSPRQPPFSLSDLEQQVSGLLYPSETDAPLKPFFWPQSETVADKAHYLAIIAQQTNTRVDEWKTQSLGAFFKPLTQMEEWHNSEEKAEIARFVGLEQWLTAHLERPQVLRRGRTEKILYLIGSVPGGYGGFQTLAVET